MEFYLMAVQSVRLSPSFSCLCLLCWLKAALRKRCPFPRFAIVLCRVADVLIPPRMLDARCWGYRRKLAFVFASQGAGIKRLSFAVLSYLA